MFLLGIVFIFCAWLTGLAGGLIFWLEEQLVTFMDKEHTNNKLNHLLLEFKRGNARGCGRDLKLIGLFFLDPPTTLLQMDGKCCCTSSAFFCLFFNYSFIFSKL